MELIQKGFLKIKSNKINQTKNDKLWNKIHLRKQIKIWGITITL